MHCDYQLQNLRVAMSSIAWNRCREDAQLRLKIRGKTGIRMDQQTQPRRSGSYTANLLGNIRNHLAGFQGCNVIVSEPNRSGITCTKSIQQGAGAVTPVLLKDGESGAYVTSASNWWRA